MNRNDPGPSNRHKQKALVSLTGGVGFGIAVGAAIGLLMSSVAAGLGIALAFGAGGGGVLAALYFDGDLE